MGFLCRLAASSPNETIAHYYYFVPLVGEEIGAVGLRF